MIIKTDINGNPYIGVFCACSENFLLVGPQVQESTAASIAEALEVEPLVATVGGVNIPGVLVAVNKKGIVVSDIASDSELESLSEHFNVLTVPDKQNAVGNNILVNDNKALVNPEMKDKSVRMIEEHMGVKAVKGTIGGYTTVGAAAVVNSKGIICHPYTTEEEKALLEKHFDLPMAISTANYGNPLLGACMAANTKGAAVGEQTTGVELNRIEDALGYLD